MNKIDVEKLMILVSNSPQLFDPKHKKYNNVRSRDLVWSNIGQELKSDGNDCKERWNNLRACYKRSLRNYSKSGDRKRWKHEDSMAFLRPYVKEIGTSDETMSNECEDCDKEHSSRIKEFLATDINVNEFLETHNESPNSQMEMVAVSTTKKRPKMSKSQKFVSKQQQKEQKSDDDTLKSCLLSMSECNKKLCSENVSKETDALAQFFSAMSKVVRTLPPLAQAKVKSEVYAAVSAAEFKYLEELEMEKNSSQEFIYIEN